MNTHETAAAHLALGWSPIPLPAGRKHPPPDGLTGWRGRYLETLEKQYDWTANLAIRLWPDIIGLDVDAYALGAVSLRKLELELGPLPPTVMSTSRADGSGIRLFRVPNGTTLQGAPAEGIQIVQAHHRYVVCFPSIHPEHRTYVWIDTLSGEEVELPPEPNEIPDLPWAWIEALSTTASSSRVGKLTGEAAESWIDDHTATSLPGVLELIMSKLAKVHAGGRHDALVVHACWAMRSAAAGEISAGVAIDELGRWWASVVDAARADGTEFAEALLWAMAQAIAEQAEAAAPHLDEAFWTARPTLAHIRAAARARRVSPAAVLGAVLARVAAFTPPSTCVPNFVGEGAMPLSTYIALVAGSGSGKSAPVKVAAALIPTAPVGTIGPLGLGSGEGLAEAYLEKKPGRKKKEKTRHGALFNLDEGRFLIDIADRSGTSTVAVLCSAWSGATLGQANASQETFRLIPEGTYSVGLISLWQPAKAGGLLGEGLTGLPQRFVFLPTDDRGVPRKRPEWPGPLEWTPPHLLTIPLPLTYPPEVAELVDEGAWRRLDEQLEESAAINLDAHMMLIRLKLAGLLAVLEGRRDVDLDDWALAGRIVDVSRHERDKVVEVVRSEGVGEMTRRLEHAAARRRVEVTAEIEAREAHARAVFESAIASAARVIARHPGEGVHLGRGCTKRCAMNAVAGRNRKLIDPGALVATLVERRFVAFDDDGFLVPCARSAP